jgi:CBS domain-containing protein
MAKLARDIMTFDPACCSLDTPLDEVARLMVQYDCGEIPVVDRNNCPIGVVTDRDIVCRVVAQGRNPAGYTAEACMSAPVLTVPDTVPIDEVIALMEDHQIRRLPVVDDGGCCAGIISQADLAATSPPRTTAELLSLISRATERPSM